MRREKKLATAMVSLFIDDEQKKLYDKIKDLELSHKRMKRLLRQCYGFCKISYSELVTPFTEDYNLECRSLMERISRELTYPYYRCNWRVKGGKNA